MLRARRDCNFPAARFCGRKSCSAISDSHQQHKSLHCAPRSFFYVDFERLNGAALFLAAAPAVIPAFVQSNVDKKATARCIDPQKERVVLLLSIKNSNLPFLNAKSYVGSSLRLNGESQKCL